MSLCQQDRDVLDLWEHLGDVPDDQSTRDVALRLLFKLWAAYKDLDASLAEVLADRARHPLAEQLRYIANDLRSAGDVPLVMLSDEGVTRTVLTLADELWLVAVQLDGHMTTERTDGEAST